MSDERKPRIWTIRDGHTSRPSINGPAIAYAETVHVVEESAYEEVCAENERLMNVEYWPDRARNAEAERDRLKLLAESYRAMLLKVQDLAERLGKNGMNFLAHTKLGDEIRAALEGK